MNRIRYNKEGYSVKIYKTTCDGEVRAIIFTNNNGIVNYTIVDAKTQELIIGGGKKTLHAAKKAVKKDLESLGVVFEKEERIKNVVEGETSEVPKS